MQITATMRAAATRMQVGGTAAKNIHFTNLVSSYAPCEDTDGTCLFRADGGGATWPAVPRDALDPAIFEMVSEPLVGFFEIERTASFDNLSIVGAGTDAKDAILIIPGLSKGVCETLNKTVGITGIPLEADVLNENDKTLAFPDNKVEGCFFWADSEVYAYVASIIEN